MPRSLPLVLGVLLALSTLTAHSQTPACTDCHLPGDDQMHAMLESKHGAVANCESCHAASSDHMQRPTLVAPGVSYGPRWTATSSEQDQQCLACHQKNTGADWGDALHMAKNVTCVSCHDLHVEKDRVTERAGQFEVCTTCHKNQKTGIHGKERMVRMNPGCTTCHNPHGDQRPEPVMLANDSKGCRQCHKLDAMARSDKVSAQAKTYHRAMDGGDLTCSRCHGGVAHGSLDSEAPFEQAARSSGAVTLFYPGQSDSSWILTRHPGSQPLRQGASCQTCHRGDEASMGASLGGSEPTSREISTAFRTEAGKLIMTLSWPGAEDDRSVAVMWGFGDNEGLRRGGCWAACHADMPGMTGDRSAGIEKYLTVSRQQMQASGRQTVVKTDTELAALMQQGNFGELWKLNLKDGGKMRTGTILAAIDWRGSTQLQGKASYDQGRWHVTVTRPLNPQPPLQPVVEGRSYTFGIALHGDGHTGGAHWVSLPTTFSTDGDDTNFRAD